MFHEYPVPLLNITLHNIIQLFLLLFSTITLSLVLPIYAIYRSRRYPNLGDSMIYGIIWMVILEFFLDQDSRPGKSLQRDLEREFVFGQIVETSLSSPQGEHPTHQSRGRGGSYPAAPAPYMFVGWAARPSFSGTF